SVTLPRPVGDGQGLQPIWRPTFVRVTADDGTDGWGQGGGAVPGAMLIRQQLGLAIVGMDPLDTTLIHDRLARLRARRRTLGAIDIALWDLKGKLLGLPIYRLLGGARRERIPAYASLHNYSESPDLAEELRALVLDARRQGYRGLKLKIGGRPLKEDLRYVA